MMRLRTLLARLAGYFHRRRDDIRLTEEIEAHLDLLAADFERRGMSAAEARRAARREFGGIAQMRELHREQRGLPFLDTLAQDLRYAFRQLRASPVFAAAAVLTLALGIGANTAIFRVLDAVVLRSLPVKDPAQLVLVDALRGDASVGFSYPLFREFSSHQHELAGIAAMADAPLETFELSGGRSVENASVRMVSGAYFSTLGVGPAAGRVLSDPDDEASAPPVAVISDGFWQRVFGGAPGVIGQSVRINHAAFTIAGITPRGFFGETVGSAPDAWIALSKAPDINAGIMISQSAKVISVMGRLRPDVSARRAQSALGALYGQVHELASQSVTGSDVWRVKFSSGSQGLRHLQKQFSQPLWILMAIVGLVLLIACCNLANLLMARATARSHEIGIRLALGAGRGRLLRQLLTESLLLAALGTIGGLALSSFGSRELISLAAAGAPWRIVTGFGWRVLAFTAVVSTLAVCLFGLVPALAATRLDLHLALAGTRRSIGTGRHRALFGKGLVVAQIAISLLLVAFSALLVRSFWNLMHQDFGYRADGVLLVDVPFSQPSFALAKNPGRLQVLEEQLRALPGVRSVTMDTTSPFSAWQFSAYVSLPGRAARSDDKTVFMYVSPSYFETMNVPILAGRALTAADRGSSPGAAVLSQTAARKLFGGVNPIGRLVSQATQYDAAKTVEVVGVAGDVRPLTLRDPAGFLVYLPPQQNLITSIAIRTAGDPQLLVGPIRRTLRDAAGLRTARVQTVWDAVRANLGQEHLMAVLSGVFGLLALLLASVGLYGVIAYNVQRRTQEIGVRIALGATRASVTSFLMREVGLLLLAGVALGVGATLLLARPLRAFLYGLSPHDPVMLLVAVVVLGVVAAAAGYLPARRAARLDPMLALRRD